MENEYLGPYCMKFSFLAVTVLLCFVGCPLLLLGFSCNTIMVRILHTFPKWFCCPKAAHLPHHSPHSMHCAAELTYSLGLWPLNLSLAQIFIVCLITFFHTDFFGFVFLNTCFNNFPHAQHLNYFCPH